MEYKVIGKSNLSVSEIGLGCMSLLKSPGKEAANIIAAATDAGINYFDTADLYDKGQNEALVGKLLKPVRNKIILATKVGNQWREDGSGWDWNPRKDYILEAVDKSLKRLQTDYIDLYQLHGGTIDDPIEETIEAFEQLVQQGKIRYYGISSIRPNVIRKYVELSNIQSVMMQYSLLDRRPEEEMIGYLHQHHISVLARGALAQGLLVNKPAKDYQGYSSGEVLQLQQALSQEKGSTAALAIHYVLRNAAVASAVTGFSSLQQLEEVVAACNTKPGDEVLEHLRQLILPKKYTDHR
ncbi:MAG: aldo/keto reductase [Niabella sp.]